MKHILVLLIMSFSSIANADFVEDVPSNPKYSYWIQPGSNQICHDYKKPIKVLVATPYIGCFSAEKYNRNQTDKNCKLSNGRSGYLKGITSQDISSMTFQFGAPLNFDHIDHHVLGTVQSIDKVGGDLYATFMIDEKYWELIRRGYVYRSIEFIRRQGFFGDYPEFVGLALTKTPVVRKQDPLPQPCSFKAKNKKRSR